MKKILIIIVFFSTIAVAQDNKHILRTGLGINVIGGYDKNVVGFSNFTEYQYNFSNYIGAFGRFVFSENKSHDNSYETGLRGSLGVLYTPFAKSFRFVKIGTYLSYKHRKLSVVANNGQHSLMRFNDLDIGITMRVYAIDNHRLELSVGYDLIYGFYNENQFGLMEGNGGIYFGVKF